MTPVHSVKFHKAVMYSPKLCCGDSVVLPRNERSGGQKSVWCIFGGNMYGRVTLKTLLPFSLLSCGSREGGKSDRDI